MAHKGLNRDVIVDEGCRLVEEKGIKAERPPSGTV